jgi:hypothetical protein
MVVFTEALSTADMGLHIMVLQAAGQRGLQPMPCRLRRKIGFGTNVPGWRGWPIDREITYRLLIYSCINN